MLIFYCPHCSSSFFVLGNSPLFINSVVFQVLENRGYIRAETVGSCWGQILALNSFLAAKISAVGVDTV